MGFKLFRRMLEHNLKDIGITSSESEKIVESLLKSKSKSGFKTGGIGELVKKSGEDGIAMVRNGEGFVAPEDVGNIQDLLKVVPDVTELIKANAAIDLKNLPKTKTLTSSTQIDGGINLQFDFPNVTNKDEVLSLIKSDTQVQKAIQSRINYSLGRGGQLDVKRIR